MRLLITTLLLAVFSSSSFSQLNRIHMLKNCQGEMRIATYKWPTSMMYKLVLDLANLRTQRILEFSSSYKLDTAWLQSQLNKVKQLLPANFRNDIMGINGIGDWYDHTPDEAAIWFTNIFCQEDKNKNIKIFAAIRLDFEGTDARNDEVRANARIKNIRFIFDKDELSDLAKIIKSSTKL